MTPLRLQVIEGPPVGFEHSGPTGGLLPTLDDDIAVARVELDQPGSPPVRSAAISVVPLPPNGSSTSPPRGLELRIARSTSPTGFIVGCRSLRLGRSMNQTSPWSRAPHQWCFAPSGQP